MDQTIPQLTLEEFLKTPIGRKVPPVTRLIASKRESGDAPEVIARALGISTDLVNSHIKIIRNFPCRSLDEKLMEEEQEEEDLERAAAASHKAVLASYEQTPVESPERFQKEMERERKASEAAERRRQTELESAVRDGDVPAINRLLPILQPSRVSLEGLAERRAEALSRNSGDGGNFSVDDAIGQIMHKSENETYSDDQSDGSGRKAMHRLLQSATAPALDRRLRRVVKLWARGMSEEEIAIKLKKSQPTISRMIVEAKNAVGISR